MSKLRLSKVPSLKFGDTFFWPLGSWHPLHGLRHVQSDTSGQTLAFVDFVFWSSAMLPRCTANFAQAESEVDSGSKEIKVNERDGLTLCVTL